MSIWLLLWLAAAGGPVRAYDVDPSVCDVEWDSPKLMRVDITLWVYLIRDGVTKERWDRLSDIDRAKLMSSHAAEADKRGESLMLLNRTALRGDLSLDEVIETAKEINKEEDWLTGTKPRSRGVAAWVNILERTSSILEETLSKAPPGGDPAAREAARKALDELKASRSARMAADPAEAAAGFDGSGGRKPGADGAGSGAAVRDGLGPDESRRIQEAKSRRLADGNAPPTPDDARRKELIDRIASRTSGDVPPERLAESMRLRREQLKEVPVDVLERMDEDKSHMVLVPDGKKISDLPESQARRPKGFPLSLFGCTEPVESAPLTTLDGRKITESNASGLADVPQADGSVACFAKADKERTWPQATTEIHEWGHMTHTHLGPADKVLIRRLYEECRAGKAPFSDTYAAVNEHEYFAMATEIWFGVHQHNMTHKEAAWLSRNQPELAGLLRRVYGPPRLAAPPAKPE